MSHRDGGVAGSHRHQCGSLSSSFGLGAEVEKLQAGLKEGVAGGEGLLGVFGKLLLGEERRDATASRRGGRKWRQRSDDGSDARWSSSLRGSVLACLGHLQLSARCC